MTLIKLVLNKLYILFSVNNYSIGDNLWKKVKENIILFNISNKKALN